MSAYISIHLRQSMSGSARLLAGISSAVLIVASVIAGFEGSAATAHSGVEVSGNTSGQTVNRMRKGSRLPSAATFHRNGDNRPKDIDGLSVPDLKLADGCESSVSFLADLRLARVAARCMS